MIEVSEKVILPEAVIAKVRTGACGCVATYVGLIRDNSHGKSVLSVEYQDTQGNAQAVLEEIANEVRQKWAVENVAICHRTGRLAVGEINFLAAVAAAHRSEAFAACRYIVDQFKERLPTAKIETYSDGSRKVSVPGGKSLKQ